VTIKLQAEYGHDRLKQRLGACGFDITRAGWRPPPPSRRATGERGIAGTVERRSLWASDQKFMPLSCETVALAFHASGLRCRKAK
jgi:hypothetical protein